MGKFDGVLLVSDFDDTLYSSHLTSADSPDQVESDSGTGPILSPENQTALEYFIAQGGKFSVATGRSYRAFARYFGRLPMNAPAILSNGSVIYDFAVEKELFRANLRPEIVADMNALSTILPSLGFETQLDHYACIFHPNEITWRHIQRLGLIYAECPLGSMPQPWAKLVIQDAHDILAKAQTFIKAHWGDFYEAIFSNDHLLEITPKSCTKGGMVRVLSQVLDIRPENLYCIGDNQNDIPMLEISAVPYAPANCAQELKDWGATLLKSCEEHCVAQLIGILDEKY